MIISTTITRNKKPSQAVYQMANPEQLVKNEPTVEAKVELGDEESIPSEPAPIEDQESVVPTESETTNSSEPENVEPEQEQSSDSENVEQEQSSDSENVEQEQSSEPEMQPEQEEQLEVTPKKKASSKKK